MQHRIDILFLQRRLPHYRVPFFEALRDELEERQLRLVLAVGEGFESEAENQDSARIPWAVTLQEVKLTHRYWDSGIWIPTSWRRYVGSAAVIVVPHELRQLPFWTSVHSVMRSRAKLAFFGHGKNFQSVPESPISARLKAWAARRADWWFAYTSISRDALIAQGVTSRIISVINNSTDTRQLLALRKRLRDLPTSDSHSLGSRNCKHALVLGTFHKHRRLPFLFESLDLVKAKFPTFRAKMIGAGPLVNSVIEFASTRPWIEVKGVLVGAALAAAAQDCLFAINPGMVGLNFVDACALGLPTITTSTRLHSPEIAYLRPGYNGLIAQDNVDSFVQEVSRLLSQDDLLRQLTVGAISTAQELSCEDMARRFAIGIQLCVSNARP